jgi:hypothetical protein
MIQNDGRLFFARSSTVISSSNSNPKLEVQMFKPQQRCYQLNFTFPLVHNGDHDSFPSYFLPRIEGQRRNQRQVIHIYTASLVGMMDDDELKEYQTQLGEVEGLLLASPDDPSLLSLKSDLLELIATTVVATGRVIPPQEEDATAESSSSKPLSSAVVTEQSPRESSSSSLPPPAAETGVVSGWSSVAVAATSGDAFSPEQQQQHQQQGDALHDDDLNDTSTSTATNLLETAADRLDPESAKNTTAGVATNASTTVTAAAPSKKTKPKRKLGQDDKDIHEDSVFHVPRHLVIDPEADSQGEQNRKRRAIKALKNKWRGEKKEAEARTKQKSWQSFQKKVQSSSKKQK